MERELSSSAGIVEDHGTPNPLFAMARRSRFRLAGARAGDLLARAPSDARTDAPSIRTGTGIDAVVDRCVKLIICARRA